MSYTRRFKKDITVHYSGSVHYPKSESGGYQHYEGSQVETIEFEVLVDTDQFEESVHDMKGHVDLLTGSVVATETAQVAQVHENSKNISQTIINGFFKTVRSDISQQIAILKNKSEALLAQLNELTKRCNDKKRTMNVDYQRISSRYTKIFDELNKELENRIHSLDEPVIKVAERIGHIDEGMSAHVAVPTVHSKESSKAMAQVTMAHTKHEATNAIGKMTRFLEVQYQTDGILRKCLHEGGENEVFTAPYCIMEATDSNGTKRTELHRPDLLQGVDSQYLINSASDATESGPLPGEGSLLNEYFKAELAENVAANSSEHNLRVARMADQLYKNNI